MVDTTPTSKSGLNADSGDAGDLEKGAPASLREQDGQDEHPPDNSNQDPNVVDWDGPDDPENPLNWSLKKKGILITSISVITFLTLVVSLRTNYSIVDPF